MEKEILKKINQVNLLAKMILDCLVLHQKETQIKLSLKKQFLQVVKKKIIALHGQLKQIQLLMIRLREKSYIMMLY